MSIDPRLLARLDSSAGRWRTGIAAIVLDGKAGSPGAGFQADTASKAEDYARQLLELYGQCLAAVQGNK